MKNEDFSSFFGSSFDPTLSNQKIRERQANLGNGNIYAYNCEFADCKATSSNGGAICVSSSSSTQMLVDNCMFQRCRTISSGICSCIYYSNGGSIIISKVCAFNCSSASGEAFCGIWCTLSAEYKNYVLDSSVCCCTAEGTFNLANCYVNINQQFMFGRNRHQLPELQYFHLSLITQQLNKVY